MSLHEYQIAQEVNRKADWGEDFYALVMVLMRNADTANQAKLKAAWPEVWAELEQRYNAPGGLLVGESKQVNTGVDPASFETHERREDGLYVDGERVRAI
jgi:hypothetical protein